MRERPCRPVLRLATSASLEAVLRVRCAQSPSRRAPILCSMSTLSTPARAEGAGIPDSALAGPFPVGEYAAALRAKLRSFAHVQLMGELVNLRGARARVYFELRDASGAVPCSVVAPGLGDDVQARGRRARGGHAGGGGGRLRLLPGQHHLLAVFSFSVLDLRLAGEGDLLARIERLRRQLDAEGLLANQKALARPLLPRSIGVVTGEGGKARDDVQAALARRGWAGRLVWAFTPVQDRHAAPAIVRALGDLAAVAEVDVVIVARGGGSLSGPAVLLRRDPVPHGRAAGGAGDRVGRPPHRPHAARRRRGGQLLDPDPRRGGGSGQCDCARGRARAEQAAPHALPACASTARRAVLTRARLLARCSRARPRRTSSASARACTSSCARSAPAHGGGVGGRARAHRAARAGAGAQDRLLAADCRERRPRELEQPRARARRARPAAHARARLRARRSQRDGKAVASTAQALRGAASCGCASPTARCPRGSFEDERRNRAASPDAAAR